MRLLLLTLVFYPGLRSGVHAQINELPFERIPSELGLSQNLISAILQDRKGFLWFGTKDGLNKFDGYQFTVYQNDAYDATSLSHNFVTSLHEDREGRIWVGTQHGLNLFDPNSEIFHRSLPDSSREHSVSHAFITGIVEDPSETGTFWIATYGGGLNELVLPAGARDFTEASFSHFRHDPNVPRSLMSDVVLNPVVDGRGRVWARTSREVFYLAKGQNGYEVTLFDPDPPHPAWKTRLEDDSNLDPYLLSSGRNGGTWIWADVGLIRLEADMEEIRYYNLLHEEPPDFSWTVYEDRAGIVWIGFDRGLGRFDPSNGRYVFYSYDAGQSHSLPESGVKAILEDEGGVLWLGSNGHGLFRHDPKAERFARQRAHTGATAPPAVTGRWLGNSLRAICETRDGALWLGTADRKFFRLDRATGAIAQPPEEEWRVVYSMVQDRTGALWIGSSMGLFRMDWRNGEAGRIEYFEPEPEDPKGLGSDWVFKVFEDRDGEIWIATAEQFSRLNRTTGRFESFRYASLDPGAVQQSVFPFIHQDQSGVFWLGAAEGLLRFDRETGSFKRYRNDPEDRSSLSHNIVRAIADDPFEPEKILWVGTAGGGLNRFDMFTEEFTHFTVEDGLPDRVIYAILSDGDGHLWMSTNGGLSRFDPRTLTFTNYDVNDGLQDNEFNAGSFFKSPSGELFFGGIGGFNAFYPEDIQDNPHVPPIALTGFWIFNEPVSVTSPDSPLGTSISDTQEITLGHHQKVFSLEFAALDYTDPAKNRYAYMMENFDENWQQAGTSRTATYTNLDPGDYVFHVKGANNDGVWNEEAASIRITITPPWWQTSWAYSLYVLSAIVGLYLIRRHELNRIELKNQARVEHIEAEKLRELDQMKSRFFANISHEFRTPLTLILGQIDSMRALFEDPTLKARLEMAFRNARQLLRLINQLLDLSQLEAGHMKLRVVHGNIVPRLKSLTYSFESLAAKKKIHLRFESATDDLQVDHEPEKIEKILHNLLSNAFKFTQEGGSVKVAVAPAVGTTFAEITVRDSGLGIPAADLPHIFDRFYRVNRSTTPDSTQAGTGIGLALTKELVELHGGEISVSSEEGFGATFVVRLPATSPFRNDSPVTREPSTVDEPSSPSTDPTAPVPGIEQRADGEKAVVLIVEDNTDLRAYVHEHLAGEFRVEEARDGEEGLAKALGLVPDLVITDVMMPKVDGYALSRKLRSDEKTSHIPIIVLTARAEEADKIIGLQIGVDDYLTKPFSPTELQVRVRNLIALREKLRKRFSQATVIKPSEVTVVSADQKFLERLRETVEANMENEDFDIHTLSAEIGMSERQLERKLKALIDQTPSRFVRSMRLERAKQLLEQDAGTVSEIAFAVGFNSIPYFSKAFRDAFGKPPSEWKAKA